MNYEEAIKYIEDTGKFGINLGLKRIERLCQLLGNPEKGLRVIHVAGTNGKGSTTAFISSVLMNQGYKVGIYTSPYIERFTERIKINDKEILEDEVAKLVTEMLPCISRLVEEGLEHPTEFEIITAAAFKYFNLKKVDYVVLEVGLGGRYDATNVVNPLLSVITTISLDHVNILGNTLSKIAYEKGGIIKEGVPVVSYPQEKEAMDVLLQISLDKNTKIYDAGEIKYTITSDSEDGIVFDAEGIASYKGLHIRLLGVHQVKNALTALKSLEVLRSNNLVISDESIYNGFLNAAWPGRFEIIMKKPYVVLDGGHNIQGIEALVDGMKRYFTGRRIIVVCGMLRDKSFVEMVQKLGEISNDFITVAPENPRALSALELKELIESMGKNAVPAESIKEAVVSGLGKVLDNEVLLFCGSLYMIGEARTIINNFFK